MPNIELQTHVYRELKSRLLQANPELAQDEQTLLDTLEGATDLEDGLASVALSALEDEAFATALKGMIADMETRKSRFADRAQKRRELILWAMQEAGLKKIAKPAITLGLSNTAGKVVITDPDAVPDKFKTPQDPKIDKKAIADAIKAEQDVPGAMIGNGGISLNVRKT